MPSRPPVSVPAPRRRARGFTLIELMVAVVVVAVLAAIALPSYRSYVIKSRARAASADLVALGLNFESSFQRNLAYPVIAAGTSTSNSAFTSVISGWGAAESTFAYSVASTASGYAVTAVGPGTGSNCTLTLSNTNARTATSSCGFSTW